MAEWGTSPVSSVVTPVNVVDVEPTGEDYQEGDLRHADHCKFVNFYFSN